MRQPGTACFVATIWFFGYIERIFHDATGDAKYYQVIVPHHCKYTVLKLIHCDLCAHAGVAKCAPIAQEHGWWYTWKRDLKLFIECCPPCCAYFRGAAPKQGYLNPMILGGPCERWSGEFPASNNCKLIFTAFSKFAIAVPIRNKDDCCRCNSEKHISQIRIGYWSIKWRWRRIL